MSSNSRGLGSPPAAGWDGSEVMTVRHTALVMDKGWMRASDRDREVALAVLRDAYISGRLRLDEFRDRTAAALIARTWDELRTLTADIPASWDQDRWLAQLEAKVQLSPGPPGRPSRRPFTPMALMGVVWLVIALAAPVPVTVALPLMLLAFFALWSAGWRAGH